MMSLEIHMCIIDFDSQSVLIAELPSHSYHYPVGTWKARQTHGEETCIATPA